MLCVRGSTGRDTYALLQKQFSHLGLPHWNRIPIVAAESVKVIHMYMFLSDGGPDQRLFKKLVLAETQHNHAVWVFVSECHCHISHLISKDHLRLTDKFLKNEFGVRWRFFSSISKLVHIWRDNSQLMRRCIEIDHGVDAGLTYASCLPPRCLSGRWGSIWDTVAALYAEGSGPAIFGKSFVSMIKPGLNKEKERRKDNGDTLCEISLEEIQAYRARLGRWKADALEVASDDLFWSIVAVNKRASGPLVHYLRLASCSDRDKTKLEENGSFLSRLSCKRASELVSECAELLRTGDTWLPQALGDLQLSDENAHKLRCYTVSLVSMTAAAFHWRVVLVVARYVCFFKIAESPLDQVCAARRAAS